VSVAAAQSKDNRATVNLALRLPVQVRAKREAEKSVGNLAPINLQPRRLPVQVRAKREADEREGKAPLVNLPASKKAERQLPLSKGRGNRSAERKKAKRLRRRGHNYLANFRSGSGQKSSGAVLFKSRFVGRLYQTPGKFAIKPRGVWHKRPTNPRRLTRRQPIRDLLVVGKTFLIRPLFPVRDQSSSDWILSNVIPLFTNRFRCSMETIKATRLPSPCFAHAIRFVKPAFKPF
jgi:hypothetical protein